MVVYGLPRVPDDAMPCTVSCYAMYEIGLRHVPEAAMLWSKSGYRCSLPSNSGSKWLAIPVTLRVIAQSR